MEKKRCDKKTGKCCQTERSTRELKLCRSDRYQKVDDIEKNLISQANRRVRDVFKDLRYRNAI